MSEYVKQEVRYVVARKNTTTQNEELMQYQEFAGNYMPTKDIKSSTEFETVEKANQLKDMLNMIAKFTGATFEYYVLKIDTSVAVVE